MIWEGAGETIVAQIRSAERALVFISVPWSGPERQAREVFRAAASRLEELVPELHVRLFRLEVDEDQPSLRWLSSLGLSQYAEAGAGSLIWLEEGIVTSSELNATSLGIAGIVGRSASLWPSRA